MRVGRPRVLLVGFLMCGIVICLKFVSATPLWECCLTSCQILKKSPTLLCVALSIVRELPTYKSLSFPGDLVGCSMILIHLKWPFQTLLFRKKGLTVSSIWTIPLMILLHRHHSNHIMNHLFELILWRESLGKLARQPWWIVPVAALGLLCSYLGLWLGVPLSIPFWSARIVSLCLVVWWPHVGDFWWYSGTAWMVPASFSGFFGSLQLCTQLWSLKSWQCWPSHQLEKYNISLPMLQHASPFCSFFMYVGSFPPVLPVASGAGKCCESHALLSCWSCPVVFHLRSRLPLWWSYLGIWIWCTVVSPLGFSWVSYFAECIPLECGWEAEYFVVLSNVWVLWLSLLPRESRLGSLPNQFANLREQLNKMGCLSGLAWHKKSFSWPHTTLSSSRIHQISQDLLTVLLLHLIANLWSAGCGGIHCISPLPVDLVPENVSSYSRCLELGLLLSFLHLHTGKENSSIIWPHLSLCGITSIGDTFSFFGFNFFTSSHGITYENPASTW